MELTEQAFEDGKHLVEPAVLFAEFPVEAGRHNRITLEGGGRLTGRLITEHLGGAERVVVMLCTIGSALGEKARTESYSRLSYAFALDAVGSAAVHALSAAACNTVEQSSAADGLQTSLPLSPGMVGWGVDPGQREIFSIIDPEPIGVTISPTLEMYPLKSLTAVVGVGAGIATRGAICDYCDLRDTCRQRVA